ncbi:hypothetical protein SAMN05660690_2364 [Geodermatophilus telluris]|uniref:DUF5642 domain-containing protein n=1 Tax=Geodermatophilus telluris TaxID=1190417 RepID=A0A1G6P1K9_9ACTN|nr:hypothetical protein [Geodermatophilus telluris]SDC74072.1 hypothetical protein SAMN05660690_2364 [Geodermatophilus telluris]
MIPRRLVLATAAGLLTAPLLAACGGEVSPSASSSSASSSSASSSESSAASSSAAGGSDLAPGLLPADAFGPGAQVTPVTEAQLQQGAALAGGSAAGLQVDPPECAALVQQSQPSFDEYEDVAAQVAVLGTTTTVQALVSGGPAGEALAGLGERPAGCDSVQVTPPEVGTVQIDYGPLDLPDLGDGTGGTAFTTTAVGPDGQQLVVPALVGVVQDGERAVVLVSTDTQGGTLDPTAFSALLQQAYETQAESLD